MSIFPTVWTALFSISVASGPSQTVRKIFCKKFSSPTTAHCLPTQSDLQKMLDRFPNASKLFSLTASLSKTEVLHQPAPNTSPPRPSIFIDGTQIFSVEHFKYLGSTITHDGSLDKEIDARINKASQALGMLRNRVLGQHSIRLSTKLNVYNAVVLPTLFPTVTYSCESWTLYRSHVKKLENFHTRALRTILR